MKYEVVIPSNVVEFTDLNDMVEDVTRLSGKKASIQRQFVIETEDEDMLLLFENFKSLLEGVKPPSKNGKSNGGMATKVPKGTKGPKGAVQTEMGRASRRIVETGEILSLVELKKHMAKGLVSDGTVVENHRGERFVVMSGELIKEPQS